MNGRHAINCPDSIAEATSSLRDAGTCGWPSRAHAALSNRNEPVSCVPSRSGALSQRLQDLPEPGDLALAELDAVANDVRPRASSATAPTSRERPECRATRA